MEPKATYNTKNTLSSPLLGGDASVKNVRVQAEGLNTKNTLSSPLLGGDASVKNVRGQAEGVNTKNTLSSPLPENNPNKNQGHRDDQYAYSARVVIICTCILIAPAFATAIWNHFAL